MKTWPIEFTPKLFSILKKGLTPAELGRDVVAGLLVGIVALPLAIAFGIGSGVSPENGLITAIIGGFIISAFGGSRFQIGGPTGAFVVLIYNVIQQHGLTGLVISTFLAGVILVAMGVLKLGKLLRFFPYTLVVGFTSGIAVIIFTSQIRDFFGLHIEKLPAHFPSQIKIYAHTFSSIHLPTTIMGFATLLLIYTVSKKWPKIPGSLVALIFASAITYIFKLPIATIASRFGELDRSIPAPGFTFPDLATLQQLIKPAFAIALLGGIESLLSAMVADGMTGGKHRSNMELIAQGFANIGSALFGGIPVTGAIARTATNIRAGAASPLSGIIHAATLLAIMLIAFPLAQQIPLCALAAVLIWVAYKMSEWRVFVSLLKAHPHEIVILLTTFGLTVFFDLILGIEIGMVMAAFLFVKRVSDSTDISPILSDNLGSEETSLLEQEVGQLPKGLGIFEISGPLFFGVAQKFSEIVMGQSQHRAIIIRMRLVPMIDETGKRRLLDIVKNFKANHLPVLITETNERVQSELIKNSLLTNTDFRPKLSEAIAEISANIPPKTKKISTV